jgi:hypothetical protein
VVKKNLKVKKDKERKKKLKVGKKLRKERNKAPNKIVMADPTFNNLDVISSDSSSFDERELKAKANNP